jgi:hypothetical protein
LLGGVATIQAMFDLLGHPPEQGGVFGCAAGVVGGFPVQGGGTGQGGLAGEPQMDALHLL